MIDLIEQVLTSLSSGPLSWLTYALVAGIIFSESGLFVGFFLPGDSLLVAAGTFAALDKPLFNIWVLLPLLFVAAVAGDNVGYWFGKRAGPRIFNREDSRLFKRKYLLDARAFYEKHGGKAILLARFVPIVRTFAPIVAGAVEMTYKHFFMFNVVGGFLWAVGVTLIGYYFGNIPFVKRNLEVALIGVIIISLVPMFIHWWTERRKQLTADH